jgi:hypothetical protein
MVLQDHTRGAKKCDTGEDGMSAKQVVPAAQVRQMEECSYLQLEFNIVDSRSYRKFLLIGLTYKGFKKSAMCSNIKDICANQSVVWGAIGFNKKFLDCVIGRNPRRRTGPYALLGFLPLALPKSFY